jgi:prolyl-tRNA synthetase
MRWSKSYLFTLKETPADAEIPSHILLVRGGYIRKLAPGISTYGPLMLRAIKKFEMIVREELDKRGCTEILMPMVQPKEIWEETGRWKEMGDGLQKLKNRNGHEFCLGATHEEAVTDFVRKDVKSYRDLPFNLYQIQTKFRDEIRPRFGLMRGREFIMKDAYSFDRDFEGAQAAYTNMYEAYKAIFERLGVKFRIVQADSGNIGGNQSQEFHILADSGEDQLLVSDSSDFAANMEVCPAMDADSSVKEDAPKAMEEFATPKLRTIDDLAKATGIPAHQLVKTMFFSASDDPKQNLNPVAVLLRGSDEVNPVKLKNHFGLANPPMLLTDDEVQKITGAKPGSCGPVGIKIPILMDNGVKPLRNFIVGANKDDFHLKNVNAGRDFQTVAVGDFRMAKDGDLAPDGKGRLKAFRGIEVGHIFYLGTKYSRKMQANYLSAESELKPIEMGCYGIGISRTVQAVVEQNHDKDGIIWPLSIAPYHVHIALLDPGQGLPSEVADKIYTELRARNIECLIDDRSERPGVKFKDADLLGLPLRINIGAKSLDNGEVELIPRKTKQMVKVKALDAVEHVLAWIEKEKMAEIKGSH